MKIGGWQFQHFFHMCEKPLPEAQGYYTIHSISFEVELPYFWISRHSIELWAGHVSLNETFVRARDPSAKPNIEWERVKY